MKILSFIRSGSVSLPDFALWTAINVAARLPAAMGPLAAIFVAWKVRGSFPAGSILAACFIVGEVAGSLILAGLLTSSRAIARQMIVGLLCTALAFAAIAAWPHAPLLVLACCMIVAGGASAPVPGSLRAMLLSWVTEEERPQAIALETALTYTIFVASPILVAATANSWSPRVPFAVGTVAGILAAAGIMPLAARGKLEAEARTWSLRLVRSAMAAYSAHATSAIAIAIAALGELLISPLLRERGLSIAWAGPLLGAGAVAAIVGTDIYGQRKWSWSYRRQATWLLTGIAACQLLMALSGNLMIFAVAVVASGLLESALLMVRNLSLAKALPPDQQAAGYSVMYAAVGVGYIAAATLVAVALRHISPSSTMIVGVCAVLAATAGLTALTSREQR